MLLTKKTKTMNKTLNFILTNRKYVVAILVILSIIAIYHFGKSVGEFVYYITH